MKNIFKKNVQRQVDKNDPLTNSGIGNRNLQEPVAKYLTRDTDVRLENKNNSFIILGRDRQDSIMSGFGSIGDTKVGSIDIVVGLGGSKITPNQKLNPNFETDSARIYISQKTNLDAYFGLRYRTEPVSTAAVGSAEVTEQSGPRSGIGIKADTVRIIARESLKLVTGTDANNSMGGELPMPSGIDLVGNNDPDQLQAMVKGENLLVSLFDLNDNLINITKILELFLENQKKFNEMTISHYHISPFYGIPTTPSDLLLKEGPKNIMSLLKDCQTTILQMRAQLNFFTQTSLVDTGSRYILSKYNRNN
jgi:hypothetical protein